MLKRCYEILVPFHKSIANSYLKFSLENDKDFMPPHLLVLPPSLLQMAVSRACLHYTAIKEINTFYLYIICYGECSFIN